MKPYKRTILSQVYFYLLQSSKARINYLKNIMYLQNWEIMYSVNLGEYQLSLI